MSRSRTGLSRANYPSLDSDELYDSPPGLAPRGQNRSLAPEAPRERRGEGHSRGVNYILLVSLVAFVFFAFVAFVFFAFVAFVSVVS